MQGDERADTARLREYWDSVVRGTPTDAGDLDAASAAVVQQLHALYQPPLPDPAFRHRLQEELMGAAALPPFSGANGAVRHSPSIATSPPGGIAPVPQRGSPSRRIFPDLDRGRMLGHLATAALLLLTLVSAYRLFVAPHGGGPSDPQTSVPALAGTPPPALPPGVSEDTVVFQQVFDELPADAHWAGVTRTDPGARGVHVHRRPTGLWGSDRMCSRSRAGP